MIKRDLIKTFIDEIYSESPHKNYETNKIKVKSFDDTWSSDLSDMNDYGPKNNSGYRYKLVVIDNFSKFGWTFEEQICSINNRRIFENYQIIES